MKADGVASAKCESLSSVERDRLSLMEALQFDRAAHETTTRVDVLNRVTYLMGRAGDILLLRGNETNLKMTK